MSTSTFLPYVLSWLSAIGIIYGLFSRLEEVLSEDKKKEISKWLQSKQSNWPKIFVSLFDHIFGKKHFSLRCILGSVIASFVSLIIVLLGWWIVAPEQLDNLSAAYELPQVFTIMVFLNVLPDYLSLLESRWLIQWMSKVQSGAFTAVMLVLDAVITFAIFVSFSWIVMKLFGTERLPDFQEYIIVSWEGLYFNETIGVFVQTTFFTTVWAWLYVFSGFIIKLLAPLRSWLNIKDKPLHSMGILLIVLITLGYLIAVLFALAGS